jgi:aspartate/methionine/tyrosine aminotransferase
VRRVVFGDRGAYEFCELNFFNGRLRPNVAIVNEKGELEIIKEDSLKDLAHYWKEKTPRFPKKNESFPTYESIAIKTKGLCLYHPKLKYLSSFDLDSETFPVPESIKESFFKQFNGYYNQYGRTLGCPELRQGIADYENIYIGKKGFYSKENAIATLGAANAFWLLLQSIMKSGLSSLLIHSPSYYQFTKAAKTLQVPWNYIQKSVKLEDISNKMTVDSSAIVPQYQEISKALDENPDTKMLVISDPGLPYATKLPNGQLKKLAVKARNDGWVLVIDETLGEMPHSKEETNLSWLRQSMPVARIKSFSKTFGFSGIRSGYILLTNSLKEEKILGETVLESIAKQVDIAYASPPPVQVPLIIESLNVLKKRRKGKKQDPDVMCFQKNLDILSQRAKWASSLLSDYEIRHVMPEYAYTMMVFLEKLCPYPKNNFHFFESLIKKHSIWIELGGIFLQNPEWKFTTARIGLGRKKGYFEKDLEMFCKFYDKYRC